MILLTCPSQNVTQRVSLFSFCELGREAQRVHHLQMDTQLVHGGTAMCIVPDTESILFPMYHPSQVVQVTHQLYSQSRLSVLGLAKKELGLYLFSVDQLSLYNEFANLR